MKLYRMNFDLRMDRPVIIDGGPDQNHYISPGGYGLKPKTGERIGFDFNTVMWNKDDEDDSLLHVMVEDFCEDYDKTVTLNDVMSSEWDEFYVYCGEYDDPMINPKKVECLSMDFYDDDFHHFEYTASEQTLNNINNVLSGGVLV